MSDLNRFIVEVRDGVALFFNHTPGVEDGWWWGDDDDPWQFGPFASADEALADARRGAEPFRIVRWDAAELAGPDRPLPPRGHIVVIDTFGKLWVRTGEPAPGGWTPQQ